MLKKEHPYSKAIKNTYCTYFNKNVLYELGIILSFLLLLIKHIFFQKGVGCWFEMNIHLSRLKTEGMSMEGVALATSLRSWETRA